MAEVLITLGIIGVVAALTMPVLIANHQEKQTVVKLKKVYSVISNAYLSAKNEYGPISDWFSETSGYTNDDDGNRVWNDTSLSNSDLLFDRLGKYLNVVSRCKGKDTSCKRYEHLYILNGNEYYSTSVVNSFPIMNLVDGTTMYGGSVNSLSKEACGKGGNCVAFSVDINGMSKGPNTMGKDIFSFNINDNTIYPNGKPDFEQSFEENCNISNINNWSGLSCAAWVIYNENMDYLHCDDLSWQGKHKCK